MKWLLDLIWPKSPKTMAEVESSYGNSPYETLKPPAWRDDLVALSNGPTVPEVDSLLRQVVSLREEVARVKVEAMQAILEARHEAARDAAEWRGERDALRKDFRELRLLVNAHTVEWTAKSVEWCRVWEEAIAEVGRHSAELNDAIQERIELQEKLRHLLHTLDVPNRLERLETSAKWQADERKKWEEQNLYEMMQTENRVSMMSLRHGLAIETLEKANEDKEARLKQIESFFPVGWVPGTTYNRYHGDMFICVYPSVLLGKNDYSVSVSCVNDAGVGVTEERRFATLSEAMARGEQLAEELRVAMLERTVIGAPVVKQDNEAVEVSASVSSDSPKARGLQSFPVSAFGKAAS